MMLIRDIADMAGCGVNTVRRWIAKNMPTKTIKGKTTLFNESEAIQIMAALPKRNIPQMVNEPNPNGQGVEIVKAIASMIPSIVSEVIKQLNLSNGLPLKKEQKALPNIPAISTRNLIKNVVNSWVFKRYGNDKLEYMKAWHALYKDFGDRYSMKVEIRAKSKQMKGLDYLQDIGKIEELYACALELYGLTAPLALKALS